jgi:hypothetical protein
LRTVRALLGISEQEAAHAYGVTLRTYRGYEAGRRQVQAWPALRFAIVFDLSNGWILSGDGPIRMKHGPNFHALANKY